MQDALEIIFQRNYFYRRLYLLAFAAWTLSLVVIAVLISIIIFLLKNPTQPLYFATDTVSRLIHIVSVKQPNMSNDDVMAWTIDAVQKVNSYDFLNYRAELQDSQKFFTNYGWTQYKKAFTAADNLPGVVESKMMVLAQVVAPPKILTEGLLSGAYAWRLRMPLLVTYWSPPYDETSKFSNALTATVIVQRQPILQSYRGLGILQLIESAPKASPSQPQEITDTSGG